MVFGGNLGDRFFFCERLENRLNFERGRMALLFRYGMSRLTNEGLQNCLVFRDHYNHDLHPKLTQFVLPSFFLLWFM